LQGGTVPVGSSLTLRITPAADGYLRIAEGENTIASPKVRHGVAFETGLLPCDRTGPVEVQVYFRNRLTETKQEAPALTIAFNVQ